MPKSYVVAGTEYRFPDEYTDQQVQDILTKQGVIKPPQPQTPFQKFTSTLGQGNLAAGLKFLGDVVQVGDDPAARQRVRDFVSNSASALFHEPSRVLSELDAARNSKSWEEARQRVTHAMPLFGPQWDKVQHQIDQGAYAEATANFVDMLGQVLGPELAARYAPPLLKAVARTGANVAESPAAKATTAFVKAAAPDVTKGAGKIAIGAAATEAIPGVPLPTSAKAAIGGLAAAYKSGAGKQIIGGLKQGWEAGKQAYADAVAAQPGDWVQLPDGRWTRGGMTPEEALREVKTPYTPPPGGPGYRRPPRNPPPPPGAAPPPDEPSAPPPEEPPQQPPDEGGGAAAPAAATPPDDEPPGGGGGATAVPPAAAAAQTAADELQARRVAEAQQAAADINPRTEGFKERNRIKRQPAVQKFGDWLMGQGYSGDMAEAISEGTKQNLERWRMMAQQAGTDTPTPSGFRDVVKHIRAQEAAAKAAATQQSPAPPPAQPAAPEAPPKSLEEIIAAEAARRAEAARATAESMRLMRDRPYGY